MSTKSFLKVSFSKNVLIRIESVFLDIKFSALDYMKTHNAAMLKGFKTFKRKTNYMSDCDSSASKSAISDLEEFDVETMVTLFPP